MKIIKFIIGLIVVFTLNNIEAQKALTEEEKNKIITYLDSVNSTKCTDAIDAVAKYKIVEALPKVENNFWNSDLGDKPLFLYALRELHSTKAYDIAKKYLDSVNTYYEREGRDTTYIYEDKSFAIEILFDNRDFSYSEYVMNLMCCDERRYNTAIPLLTYIIRYDSINSQRALDLLINTALNEEIEDARFSAIFYLEWLKEKESIPILINIMEKEKDESIKDYVLVKYFYKKYKGPEINKALREQLPKEINKINKIWGARILLRRYGSPTDYNIVKETMEKETDSETKKSLQIELKDYRTPRPDSGETPQSMIDSLISYNNQCYELGWLSYEWVWNINKTQLENARLMLNTGYPSSTAIILQAYENWVNTAKGYGWINEDAYRFLYYYSVYLRERL
ncbi:hypothetical protein MROS_2385 [Melioribacter roseus P3M-2]|jgi:hypothetical protein|uniref:Uncharacterized protein n=1 Tax=Melioribacter roseus (strain DSM 23840 / JCM 17771 / VKM B-2668 / P3M-2) TaxID=1191523 RepID=I6Z8Z1_MELRP|nr:hypothetical protein [Melioribacter roseus]AFN75615.1 hypothetical protein MROS_2385 [Melioribacter roseus P3M-2]